MVEAIDLRNIDAYDIPVHGIFLWQNTLYRVVKHIDDHFVEVQRIAAAWTSNPYDRWQYATEASIERFNGYCEVKEFIYKY